VKLTLNTPLRNDQFELPQPAGSILVRLDQPGAVNPPPAAATPPGSH
jgi:hypothetical protein